MSEPKFKDFKIPKKILDEFYELTGGSEAYKGYIIAYSNEKGEPMIQARCDTQVTEYALHKAIEAYLSEYNQDAYEMEEDQENTWLFKN